MILTISLGGSVTLGYDDDLGFETAADFLNNGMYLEAVGMYQEIANYSDIFNNQAKAILYMGATYSLYLNQPEAAIERFEHVMENYWYTPEAAEALFNTGMVYFEEKKYGKALTVFEEYLNKYPDGLRKDSAEVWKETARAESLKPQPEIPPQPKLVIDDTTIRVLIADNKNDIGIDAASEITVKTLPDNRTVYRGTDPLAVRIHHNRLYVNDKALDAISCRIEAKDHIVRIDGRPYRESVIAVDQGGALSVINAIDIEKYLYGVVPREMPASWEPHALKTQAVAARTYALYIKQKSNDKSYDVVATTSSQVYGGYSAETAATNRAVDETKGRVITHEGKLIVSYFHSNSGGHTEDSGNVWTAQLPYLKGVSDPYSENTPASRWEADFTGKEIENSMKRYGVRVARISRISLVDKTTSGRYLKIRMISDQGNAELTSNNFRIKIGPGRMKSTLFDIEKKGDNFVMKGKGFGHGVGMSQWGAQKMAQTGFNYQDILKHYYHNVEIRTY